MLEKSRRHLQSVSEGYVQHMVFAVGLGICMILGGLASIVHGICPAIFEYTGSRTVARLQNKIDTRMQQNRDSRQQ